MLFPLYVLNPRLRFPIVTLLIIVANILVMGWLSQVRDVEQSKIAAEYGFVPRTAHASRLRQGRRCAGPDVRRSSGCQDRQLVERVSTDARDVYRRFFSMMFLHGGWMHLLMNMWMLWIFGPNIEDRLGHLVFSMFYVLGGVVAMLAFWVSDPERPHAGHRRERRRRGRARRVCGHVPDGESADADLFHFHRDHRHAGARAAGNLVHAASGFRNDGTVGLRQWSRSPSGHTSAASWPA